MATYQKFPRCGYSHARKLCLLFLVVFMVVGAVHAQSSSAIFNGPQSMDQGLQSGMNNITGYVYAILKFLSIIGLGIAYYFVTHNGLGSDIGHNCRDPSLVRAGCGEYRPKPGGKRGPAVAGDDQLWRVAADPPEVE